MDNREAVNWLINISADIGKAEHSDLWHYEQALTEIKDMLESAQFEERKESLCKKVRALCEESKIEFFFVGGGESTWSVTNDKHIKKIVECHKAQLSQEGTTKDATSDTISRQAAIDVYGDWYVEEGTADGFIGTVKQLLEGLPPAQPEPSEITDEQAILHLQSTGWMQNHDREMYESGLREQLADDSGGYDSLIPCEDTISRQAAIDALDCINGAEEVLRSLPPAQPEEAIPVAWISAQIERLKGMGNMRVDFIAEAIQTTLNEWRKEQEGETT